jgi:hypothetical protein
VFPLLIGSKSSRAAASTSSSSPTSSAASAAASAVTRGVRIHAAFDDVCAYLPSRSLLLLLLSLLLPLEYRR